MGNNIVYKQTGILLTTKKKKEVLDLIANRVKIMEKEVSEKKID